VKFSRAGVRLIPSGIPKDNACHHPGWMLYSAQVCRMSRIRNLQAVLRKTSAVLLCGMVLFVSALSASASLHKWLHHDADDPDHECAITLFAHGNFSATVVAITAAVPGALFGGVLLLAQTFVPSSADYRFSPSRAPPRASSLL
jgi:hypothetical protein